MCNVCGLNNPAKQNDVIHWHKDMNNLVSIFMESKLKEKVHSWLADKFDGIRVFTSGLDSGFLGAGVLIVVNSSLAKHVCKVSKVPGWLLSIKLLFKNKLSVSILGLYAGASSVVQAINESSFVILGGNFNEDGSHKCASFKKCFDLGLINSMKGSSFVKSPTWYNFHGITKTLNYMFISSNLVGVVVNCGVDGIEDYFDTNHRTVYVSVRLGGLLDVQQIEITESMISKIPDEFVAAKQFSDLDAMWDIVRKVMVLSAGRAFRKKWFKGFDCVFNKVSFQFHKLELLVSKLVKASWLVSGGDFASLLDTWYRLDSVGALPIKFLFLSGTSFDAIRFGLAKARKSYCSSKSLESKHAEESCIRQAIERRMESFEVDKSYIIRSVLEHSFCKVVLDHLVDGGELVLEPELVKFKVDGIMESWTRKCVVASDISSDWARQFQSLNHVFDGAFSDVMHSIGFDKMFGVISNLPDRKAAGFSVSMIPKPYEWKGILTNTHPIALVETARKVLSKILSDWISLACSTFDVLHGNNFFVLKGMSTQLPIFAIGSVEHLKRSLVRIKMCNKFIRFFGSIHNGYTNRVMTDFGLTDRYYVHNGLDQREVFSPLFWCIFYDLLLYKVKRQKSICGYRLIFHFISKTGWVESQAGLTLFLAASAFVDDTIWVGSSQAATQYILNVTAPYLTISGMPISITKRDEPHCYLGIFLSSECLLKSSLVKTHLDVWFFVNRILRKVISDKQFAYLVFSVLLPIVSYRTQFSFIPFSMCNKWDALICKGLKSKSGLSLDFSNDAENKSASVIAFVNSVGILGRLFSYKSYDLQVLSWHFCHSLLFPACVKVSPSNNFLAGVVCVFSGCDLSLGGSLAGAFCLRSDTSMSLVLGETIFFKCVSSLGVMLCDWNGIVFDWKTFKHWKKLDFHGLVSFWFDLSVHFLGGVASLSGCSPYKGVCDSSDICQSLGFGVICNDLLNVGAAHFSVYTDGSLSNLSTVDMLAGAVVFFEDINLGLGVGVSGLVFFTLVELQAIALALESVPSFHSVDLFSDSQAAIDACRFESLSVGPDFRNCCWIEYYYIANVIYCKNLDVNWIKIKGHSGVLDNERANALAKNAAFSAWHLSHLVNKRFLKAGVGTVSGNSRHFVHDIFKSIYCAHWEVGSGSRFVPGCLHANIDWLRSSLVWHLDSHMVTGFISIQMAGFRTYFMKALHHHLSVAVEISDHVFSCSSDADNCTSLLDTYAALLSTCISDVTVSTALCKGFVFGNWYHESVSVYKNPKVTVVNIVNFTIMEKNKLIPHDGSIPVTVSGFSMWLLAGVIRFGYYEHCLFYADVGNMTSVHISA
ncbi:hypothetical protein G9A89_020938 [Geosiphon pyriformis]|nr:hypothetical protein G9A89_020938 [Geosiphon pyriformis]